MSDPEERTVTDAEALDAISSILTSAAGSAAAEQQRIAEIVAETGRPIGQRFKRSIRWLG